MKAVDHGHDFSPPKHRPRIAVLVPCRNESASITRVITEFAAALPGAAIVVCDNGSTDDTAARARAAAADVVVEPLAGKGNAVRRLFAEIEADIYVLVDGDATYDPQAAPGMIARLIVERLDMVNGKRIGQAAAVYRPGHRFGNRVLSLAVSSIFGHRIDDLLSGYRVFSRRFVKSFPAMSSGFEIETEMTVHALELRLPLAEVETRYFERIAGSASKLRTFRDGARILRTIAILVRDERPLAFFATIAIILMALGIGLAVPLVIAFLQTDLVPRLPTGVLAVGIVLLGFLSLVCGIVLDTVTLGRRETKRLRYLSYPGPGVIEPLLPPS